MKAKILLLGKNSQTILDLAEPLRLSSYAVQKASSVAEAQNLVAVEYFDFLMISLAKISDDELGFVCELKAKQAGDTKILLFLPQETSDSQVVRAVKQTGASGVYVGDVEPSKVVQRMNSIFFDQVYVATPFEKLMTSPNWAFSELQQSFRKQSAIKGFEIPFVVARITEARATGHVRIFRKGELLAGLHFLNGGIQSIDFYHHRQCHIWQILLVDLKLHYLAADKETYDFSSVDVLRDLMRDKKISKAMANSARQLYWLDQLRQLVQGEDYNIDICDYVSCIEPIPMAKEQLMTWAFNVIDEDLPLTWIKSNFRTLNRFAIHYVDKIYGQTLVKDKFGANEVVLGSLAKGGSLLSLLSGELVPEDQTYKDLYKLCCKAAIWFDENNRELNWQLVKSLLTKRLSFAEKQPFCLFGLSSWVTIKEVTWALRAELMLLEDLKSEFTSPFILSYIEKISDLKEYLANGNNCKELSLSLLQKREHDQLNRKVEEERVLQCLRFDNLNLARERIYGNLKKENSDPTSELLLLWLEIKSFNKKELPQALCYQLEQALEKFYFALSNTALYHFVRGTYLKKRGQLRQAEVCFKTALLLDSKFIPGRRELFAHKIERGLWQTLTNLGRIAKSRYPEGRRSLENQLR